MTESDLLYLRIRGTEGWESLVSALIRAHWVVTASWPILTERSARMRAQGWAALASSVHLECRPRSEDAPIGDWAEILKELPRKIRDWVERLSSEGIRGADLLFACIGPSLESFSKYLTSRDVSWTKDWSYLNFLKKCGKS